jgi:hypothetical protein
MSRQVLGTLFSLNHYAVTANVAGVSHEESLRAPEAGGNCMNWVLGHIVASRNGVLAALGEKSVWSAAQVEEYKRGSSGLRDRGRARPFEAILADFEKAQKAIEAGLARISEADLSAAMAQKDIPKNPAALQFHEAYHAGQLGILRRFLGKPGGIP